MIYNRKVTLERAEELLSYWQGQTSRLARQLHGAALGDDSYGALNNYARACWNLSVWERVADILRRRRTYCGADIRPK